MADNKALVAAAQRLTDQFSLESWPRIPVCIERATGEYGPLWATLSVDDETRDAILALRKALKPFTSVEERYG